MKNSIHSFLLRNNNQHLKLDDSKDSENGLDISFEDEETSERNDKPSFNQYQRDNKLNDIRKVDWQLIYVKIFANFIESLNFKSIELILSSSIKSRDNYDKNLIFKSNEEILNRKYKSDLYVRQILTKYNQYQLDECSLEKKKQETLNTIRNKTRNLLINANNDMSTCPLTILKENTSISPQQSKTRNNIHSKTVSLDNSSKQNKMITIDTNSQSKTLKKLSPNRSPGNNKFLRKTKAQILNHLKKVH